MLNVELSNFQKMVKLAKKGMFVLREMCTFIQGIGAGNIGKTSLFTLSLYGIYKGSARYNALLHTTYCMVIKNID